MPLVFQQSRLRRGEIWWKSIVIQFKSFRSSKVVVRQQICRFTRLKKSQHLGTLVLHLLSSKKRWNECGCKNISAMPIYTILHVHGLLRSLDQSQEGCLLHHIQQARIDYFTQKYCFNCGYGKRIKKRLILAVMNKKKHSTIPEKMKQRCKFGRPF